MSDTKIIVLRNKFHNRSIRVRAPSHQSGAAYFEDIKAGAFARHDAKDLRQYRKIYRALCGNPECMCGIVRP